MTEYSSQWIKSAKDEGNLRYLHSNFSILHTHGLADQIIQWRVSVTWLAIQNIFSLNLLNYALNMCSLMKRKFYGQLFFGILSWESWKRRFQPYQNSEISLFKLIKLSGNRQSGRSSFEIWSIIWKIFDELRMPLSWQCHRTPHSPPIWKLYPLQHLRQVAPSGRWPRN